EIEEVNIFIDMPITNRNSINAVITTSEGEALYYDKTTSKLLDTDVEPMSILISTVDEYTLKIGEMYEEK
ncbi:MAG: hypothetical protein RBQ97_11285, partial [Acholeplasma sp.]|nr:hypothetical protein [Acholeplasma sp.]